MAAAAAAAAAADALRGLEVGPAPGAAAAAQAVDAVQAAAPLEDDEDDSESDDDAAAFGAAQCLPVGSSADTLSYDRASPAAAAEPTTAEEYLRRVRYEAAQLPDITVATREQIQAGGRSPRQQHGSAAVSLTRIRTSDGRALTAMLPPSMPTVPPSVRASQRWEVAFLADFSELRLQAAEARAKELGEEVSGGGVPPSDDGNAWQARLSGEMDGSDDGPGALQEMLRTSAPRVRAVLRMLCERLARMSIDTHACSLRAVVGWLFAAAACVEKPLDADTAAALRCGTRAAAELLVAIDKGGDAA
eukprot:PRCOL_00004343-RA